MVSNRCKLAVKEELKKLNLHFIVVDLGEVEIMENISTEQREHLKMNLLALGLELIDDNKAILIEKIKTVIIEMIHHTEGIIKINFSDFLSEKLNHGARKALATSLESSEDQRLVVMIRSRGTQRA
jgi:hypothetical protein